MRGRRLVPLLTVGVVLALWEMAPRAHWISPSLLPPFSAAALQAFQMATGGQIGPHAWGSLYRWFAGFGISLLFGIPVGLAMGRSRLMSDLMGPLLTALYPVPKAALMPLLMLWLGAGDLSKVVLIAAGCSIPLVLCSFHGAQGIDQTLVWSARALGTPPRLLLWRVVLPAALPEICTGIRTALGMSLFVTVASEMIVRQRGMGSYLFDSLDLGLYRITYATVLLIAIAGYLLDDLFRLITRRLLRWADSTEALDDERESSV